MERIGIEPMTSSLQKGLDPPAVYRRLRFQRSTEPFQAANVPAGSHRVPQRFGASW
jgi:hypothetical protein